MANLSLTIPDEVVAQGQQLVGGVIPEDNPMVAQTPEPEAQEPAEMTMEDLVGSTDPFDQAMEAVNAEAQAKLQEGSNKAAAEGGVVGSMLDSVNRVGLGMAQAVGESTQYFGDLIGAEPKKTFITDMFDAVDRDAKELDRRHASSGFIGGTAQFVTGMLGIGKVMEGMKLATGVGKAVQAGKVAGLVIGSAEGAAAASIVFDPSAGRLSDLAVQYPLLKNPLTEFLASDPTDTAAMGRFKNALEGVGMDLAVAGVFAGAVRVFGVGKGVAAGTLPKSALDEAEAELAELVAEAKRPGSSTTAPVDPDNLTIGGSPGKRLPEAPNLLEREQGTGNTEQQVIDNANGLTAPRDPQADSIAREVNNTLDQTTGQRLPAKSNLLNDEMREGGASGKPSGEATPGVRVTEPQAGDVGGSPSSTPIGDSIRDTAKGRGIKIGRKEGAAEVERTLARAPKIETNGVAYSILPEDQMHTIGKAYGIDTSKWLGSHNSRTGEIFISSKVLSMPPAEQSRIIMHETGHALEKQFVKRITGIEGTLGTLPGAMRKELEAASRELRSKHWSVLDQMEHNHKATERATGQRLPKRGQHKKTSEYLTSPAEMFADGFSLWKTDRAKFGELAPETAELFDQHFQPWIDHDFSVHAADVDNATQQALQAAPTGPKGVYKSKEKAVRTAEQYEQQVDVTPEAAAEVARVANNDAKALADHGSREAAEAAGYRFGKGANLPYQKLNTTEEVQAFINQTANRFKAELDELKGGAVLSDPRVQRLVQQRVDLFNEDPAMVMGQLQAAGSKANEMVANMEAAFAIANKAANDLSELVKNNKVGNYAEFGGDANAAEAALAPRLALYIEAIGAANAMRAASGRAMRRLRGDFQLSPETLANIRKLKPEDVANIVDMAGGNAKLLSKLATESWWKRFVRAAGSIYANNLLWSWTSHVRNTIGNGWMLSTTPAMRAVGSFGLREGGQDVRRQALREYRYMASSMSDASHFAVQAYLKGDSTMDPHGNEFFREAATGQQRAGAAGAVADVMKLKPINNVGDFFQNTFSAVTFALGQPTRVLGMADEFIKQMSYRGSVLAEASLKADELGLQGRDYDAFLKKQLDGSFDSEGRAINKDALYDAEVRTFSQPLLPGTAGKTMSTVVSAHPTLRFVLPFVRTPANLFRYSLKMTPILNLVQREYRQMIRGELGPKRQADAFGQMAMGSLLMTTGISLSLSGLITGGGPTDPNKQKAIKQTGWKPYSVRLTNPDGTHTYIPFNTMDPVGMQLSLIGDITQVINLGQQSDQSIDKLIFPTAIAMAKNLANRTYLQSLNDFFDAVADPDASMSSFAGGLFANAVPAASLWRSVNPDPYMRDARSLMDRALAQLPGFSDDIAPTRDWAGERVLRTTGLIFTDNADDVADAEQMRMLENYGVGVTPLSATSKGGIDLRQFKLASTQGSAFDQYQELISKPNGMEHSLKEAVGRLILSPAYARMQEGGGGNMRGTKPWAIQQIVDRYRDLAYKQLIATNPDLRQATALQEQAVRAQRAAGSPATVAGQLKAANAAFGITTAIPPAQ